MDATETLLKPERQTGNAVADLVLEAGPKLFGPELPAHARELIAKSRSTAWYREALTVMAREKIAEMHREIDFISKENRDIENTQEFKASDGLGYPLYRIPLGVHFQFEDMYGVGCWKDKDFVEDFLKHHPGLRIKVTRGTRGQQYVAPHRISGIGGSPMNQPEHRQAADATLK